MSFKRNPFVVVCSLLSSVHTQSQTNQCVSNTSVDRSYSLSVREHSSLLLWITLKRWGYCSDFCFVIMSKDPMDHIHTPKVEGVKLLDRLNPRNSPIGTLYLTTSHLIFIEAQAKKEVWILHMLMSQIDKPLLTTSGRWETLDEFCWFCLITHYLLINEKILFFFSSFKKHRHLNLIMYIHM